MRLAIYWGDLLHYHIARLQALFDLAEQFGHEIYAFSLVSKSADLPISGYQELLGSKVAVLSNDPLKGGTYSWNSKRHVLHYLSACAPDAIAIIGYDGKVSRTALGWCRQNRKAAILMLDSQEKDAARSIWKESIKRTFVNCYDAVLASGTTHVDYAVKLGMPRERILTGYNVVDNEFWTRGADQARLDPAPWRQRFALPARYFLSVGRFIPKKNFAGLIRAYAQYVAQTNTKPWSLVIVGDGALKSSLEALVADLGLTDLVCFPGYLAAQDMAPVYGLASAFILPSAFFEQWGLVVNEAMAARLPVLVSNICGCVPDLVREGLTGFSFDPCDESALTHLLVTLSGGGVDLAGMGDEAYRLITDKYSPQTFARNLMVAAEIAVTHANSRRWPLWPSPWLWP